MEVLGIETSCDETAVALLRCNSKTVEIVAEEISSQAQIHAAYGGIVPELASREHLTNLPLLVEKVISDSGVALRNISAIAVTRGPGLKGCLLMGHSFAQGLCLALEAPLLGINHIEGHIFAPMLDNPELTFPYLALVVSGGHTEIHEVHGLGHYTLVARTNDDAAGEAFDKSAHLLGFVYPGGAKLAALADRYQGSRFKLPKVMREAEGFSFSGLKTAIALLIAEQGDALKSESAQDLRGELAFAIQNSIVEALCFKLEQAIKKSHIKRVAVTGGVSANQLLRSRVKALKGVEAFFPTMKHCMDNAAMIAYVGYKRFMMGERMKSEESVLSRWPVEELAVR